MATRYSLFFFVFFTLNILQTYFADFFENKRFGYVIVFIGFQNTFVFKPFRQR